MSRKVAAVKQPRNVDGDPRVAFDPSRRHLVTLKAGNGDLKPAGGWRCRPREAVAGGELLKVAGTVVG